MPKYKNRYEYTISGASNENSDNWLIEMEKNLNKQAVQPLHVDKSMFETINSIINGKSKYRNVKEAVEEMQRRSGFLDYINKKVAQEINQNEKPTLLVKYPNIESTINNYINDTRGNLDVPSIISHVKAIHNNDVPDSSLWDEDKLIKFLHDLNESIQKPTTMESSHNLGRLDLHRGNDDVDPSNSDAWSGLMPVTKS